jgi:hypothetical protein
MVNAAFSLQREAIPVSRSITLGAGTAVENDTAKTITIPVRGTAVTPVAVMGGTSTTSPKKIIFTTPTRANIKVGATISGGSFAGTEVVSVVTKNPSGLVTEITYTGTGAVNNSEVAFTFTGATYAPVLYWLRLTHAASGGNLTATAEILTLNGSASSNSGGNEGATISSANDIGARVQAAINIRDWMTGLGFTHGQG